MGNGGWRVHSGGPYARRRQEPALLKEESSVGRRASVKLARESQARTGARHPERVWGMSGLSAARVIRESRTEVLAAKEGDGSE